MPSERVTFSVCLQDSRISVEAMLQSPYVGDIQNEAEEWCSALREIEEITDLWSTCQKKVGTRVVNLAVQLSLLSPLSVLSVYITLIYLWGSPINKLTFCKRRRGV